MGHVISDLLMRWPHARIPYEVDPALSLRRKANVERCDLLLEQHSWRIACCHVLMSQTTAFYRADIHDSGEWGGHSSTGRGGGKQDIRMDFEWSEAVGGLLHETGHAAGLLHERRRPDQGEFVNSA